MSSSKQKLFDELKKLKIRYKSFLALDLKLDMTRGKPCPEQLTLSDKLLNNLNDNDVYNKDIDYRNYSTTNDFTGLPKIKNIFAEIFEISSDNIIIGGNSSLNLMYDILIKGFVHKFPNESKNWSEQGKIKFLCPIPGYDRHFAICESFNIEMIPVPLTGSGPDMNYVEKLVYSDTTIKGIWCVPKYSNPTGEIYSNEVIKRLAYMKTAASDFRIMWDNAYSLHDFNIHNAVNILNIIKECNKANHPNRVFMFASTSKITYAGSGLAIVAANKNNINWLTNHLKIQTIGFNKINQLHHLKLLPNKNSFIKHMNNHAKILKHKFQIVDKILNDELGTNNKFALWNKPLGGYFINFNSKPGLAKNIIQMSKDAGLKLTKYGSTFPYGKDPNNSNIRIAPSFPSMKDLKQSTTLLSIVTKILTIEKQLS